VIGEISDFSSYCVDDNGKPRPTLIAPGQGIISAANNWDSELFKVKDKEGEPGVPDEENENKANDLQNLICYVEKNGRKNWYMLEQGTSMSCPHAAGIVTLWMQAKPTLTTNDILAVMQKTCVNDEFTTNVAMIPSGNKVQAGLGKIDCLAGLKEILNITGIETIEVGGHREATPSTMYSVDAPVYNMMGQRVDKNTRGLVIYKGRKYVNK
jgi:subtilisin family serine protease